MTIKYFAFSTGMSYIYEYISLMQKNQQLFKPFSTEAMGGPFFYLNTRKGLFYAKPSCQQSRAVFLQAAACHFPSCQVDMSVCMEVCCCTSGKKRRKILVSTRNICCSYRMHACNKRSYTAEISWLC